MSEDTTEVQQELETLRAALKKANAEAKANREAKEAAEARIATLESDDGVRMWRDKAVTAEVKAALREQGVKDTDRVLKVLSLEGVDLDDSGNLTGLTERVLATKKEWPELFDTKRRVANGADIFANGEVKPKISATEAQVARIFAKQ